MAILSDFDVWRAALASQPYEIPDRTVAHCGVYRSRTRAGKEYPVNIFRSREDNQIYAWDGRTGRTKLCDPEWVEQYMGYLLRRPITPDAYEYWLDHDRFPDEIAVEETRMQANVNKPNAMPDVILRETIEELRREADAWLASIGGKIVSQEDANKAANYSDRFNDLEKEAKTAHTIEKAPVLKQSKEIDARWLRTADDAKASKAWAKGLLTAFLQAEQQRLNAAATEAAPAPKVKAGTRGKAVSLRAKQVPKCTSFEDLKAYCMGEERFWQRVAGEMLRFAEDELKTGKTVPGARMVDESKAA